MLLRLIFFAVLIFLAYRAAKWFISYVNREKIAPPGKPPPLGREDLVEDPHCRIYVPKSAALKEEIGGKTHYFCSRQCRDEFLGKGR